MYRIRQLSSSLTASYQGTEWLKWFRIKLGLVATEFHIIPSLQHPKCELSPSFNCSTYFQWTIDRWKSNILPYIEFGGCFSIVAYAFSPPQQQPIPIFCSGARNQHTQGSDCHVSPHQRVFLPCTASSLLSHVNRTSLAYWLGCSPVRVLHDSSASDFKSTMMWYAMIMMNLWQAEENHRCNGVQNIDIQFEDCRNSGTNWHLPGANMIFSIDHGECWMSESYFTQHKNSKTTTWKGFFWG